MCSHTVIIWMHWDDFSLMLFCVRSSFTLVCRGVIFLPFLSNRLPRIPLKRPHSILHPPVLLDVTFLQHQEKDIIAKYGNKQPEKCWIISISEHCGVILMSLAVEYLQSGPKAQMVLLWCNPAQWLVKQTYSSQCFSSKDWYVTLQRPNCASVCRFAY